MRTSVVFPAPLGPSSPNTIPAARSRSTSINACPSRKDFEMPRALTAASRFSDSGDARPSATLDLGPTAGLCRTGSIPPSSDTATAPARIARNSTGSRSQK